MVLIVQHGLMGEPLYPESHMLTGSRSYCVTSNHSEHRKCNEVNSTYILLTVFFTSVFPFVPHCLPTILYLAPAVLPIVAHSLCVICPS
jgi:hypothetical protein